MGLRKAHEGRCRMKKEAIPRFFFVYTGYLYLVISLILLILNVVTKKLFFTQLVYNTMIFGFIMMLIFGMSYNLIPIFSRRLTFHSNKMIIIHLILANLALAFMVASYLFQDIFTLLHLTFSLLWLIGAILYVANIMLTVRKPPHDYKTPVKENTIKLDKIASKFTTSAGLYVVLGAFLLLLQDVIIPFPVIVHWHTTGVVMLMIIGVGYHVFPRITKVQVPYKTAYVGILGIFAPLLLALSRMNPRGLQFLFLAGAFLEYVAVLNFAVSLIYMVFKSPKKRLVMAYYLASAFAMIIGLSLGFSFGFFPDWIVTLFQVHAFINLFGIVTFLIFGVSFQMIFFYPTLPNAFKKFAQVFIFVTFLTGMVMSIGAYLANDFMVLSWGLALMLLASIVGAIGITISPVLIKLKLIRLENEAKRALDL